MAGDRDDAAGTPLLGTARNHGVNPSRYAHRRAQARKYLSSKQNHYVIMGLVALDVLGILIDIFITLTACDTDQGNVDWADGLHEGFQLAGLIFSSLFLVELGLSVWAFGLE